MKTEVCSIFEINKEAEIIIDRAATIIKNGGLVVFPTETVYGLGADATNSEAANKIYKAKSRPSDNPLIIHIDTPNMAEKYAYTTDEYYKLASLFMPGPLTLILKARDTVPIQTRGGLDTVAVRCPSNKIAQELIKRSGVPIAAPSANLSGSPSPTAAKYVIDDMMGRVDMIIDGGSSDFGLESTILSLVSDTPTLLRPGKITYEEISKALGYEVNIASAVTKCLNDGEIALSPGMKYRHYAPKAPVVLLDGDINDAILYIKKENSSKPAIIAYSSDAKIISNELANIVVYDFGNKDNPEEQAHLLFSLLREADKYDYSVIYAPLPKTDGLGLAIYNRMIRAAAHKIIRL